MYTVMSLCMCVDVGVCILITHTYIMHVILNAIHLFTVHNI